ncbi:MAG: flavodoxin family protein [Acholeplasmataceae bacterium]|nr:flavodoxin family protein [Acholeplasmataceae bacterium]
MTNKHTQTLIIVYSYHHNNTLKVAEVMASVLHAIIKTPDEVTLNDLKHYDRIGFGSGIDSGRHYKPLLELAATLPQEERKPAFIFSTSGVQGQLKVAKDHAKLRSILVSKGYVVLDEFSCKGFNTNSFLKFFGGMNKGKPDADDLNRAMTFARNLRSATL